MLPCLVDGQIVLIQSSYSTLQEGDIVVFTLPPEATTIVKRIFAIHDDGRLDLRGDNLELSTDSRHYGLVDGSWVIGKVVSRFP